jgi:hypothetical protein
MCATLPSRGDGIFLLPLQIKPIWPAKVGLEPVSPSIRPSGNFRRLGKSIDVARESVLERVHTQTKAVTNGILLFPQSKRGGNPKFHLSIPYSPEGYSEASATNSNSARLLLCVPKVIPRVSCLDIVALLFHSSNSSTTPAFSSEI